MKVYRAIMFLYALTLLPGVTWGQSDNRSVEQRAAQTLINTIKGEKTKPPTPGRISEFRDAAASDSGNAWAVTDRVKSKVDEKRVSVTLKISHLPENYRPHPDDQKKWEQILQKPKHKGTQAEIGFRVSQRGDVRRHRTYYRKQEGNIGLLMHVTRTGDESLEQAIAKSSERFQTFYKFAQAEGLVGAKSSINLVYRASEGGQVEISDDLQVIQAPEGRGAMDFDFDVTAFSPIFVADQPYEVELNLNSENAQLLGANRKPLPDANRNGWSELSIPDASTGRFTVRLGEFTPDEKDPYGLEELIIGTVRVRTSADNQDEQFHTIQFGIQRRSWHVIAQRVELVPDSFFSTKQKTNDSQGGVYDLDGRLGFNDLIGDSGKLIENYQDLLDRYGTPRGEISASTPVTMGWERDQASSKSYEFHIAVDARKKKDKPITAIPVNFRTRLVVDLKIVRAPKRTLLPGKPQFRVDEYGDKVPVDESLDYDVLQEEREVRRRISMDEFIVSHILLESAKGEDQTTFLKNLPARIRLAPDRERSRELVHFPSGDRRAGNMLDVHFPLTNRYEDPEALPEFRKPSLGKTGLLISTPHRFPGVYEMRFRAKLLLDGKRPGVSKAGGSKSGPSYDVDVAFRYAVCDMSFEKLLIDWKSERGQRLIDGN